MLRYNFKASMLHTSPKERNTTAHVLCNTGRHCPISYEPKRKKDRVGWTERIDKEKKKIKKTVDVHVKIRKSFRTAKERMMVQESRI